MTFTLLCSVTVYIRKVFEEYRMGNTTIGKGETVKARRSRMKKREALKLKELKKGEKKRFGS